ncbi:MAG: hypothetical protein P1P88_03405 [Bacteroidales bacterium]|nr:hypothetical protein [Bacteroidales bacterium]
MQWGKEDTDSAIFYMQKAIEEDSLYAIAWATLGHLLRYEGYKGTSVDRDSVNRLAEKAIRINPKCGDAHTLKARVYASDNEYYKAIDECKKAVEVEPDHRETWLWLGVMYSIIPEKTDSAIYAFHKSLEIDPLFGQPHQKLGWIYIYDKPDKQKAAYHFRKMIYLYENIKPRDERMLLGYYGLGEALIMDKKWDNAIDTLNLLLKKCENATLLWLDRLKSMAYSGLIRAQMGKAKSDLDKFIALNLARQDKYPNDIGITLSLIEEFDGLSFRLLEFDLTDTLKQARMPLFQRVFNDSKNEDEIIKAINYKCFFYLDEKKYRESNMELRILHEKYAGKKNIISAIYYGMARNFMMMDEAKSALKYLKRSVNQGYNDFVTMQAEFNKLSDNQEFIKIVEMEKH